MHFQIFVPQGADQPQPSLHSLGLAHLEGNANAQDLQAGPDGKPGRLYSWTADTLNYEPDRMEWIPAVPCGDLKAGRYLVGMYKGRPPAPEELSYKHSLTSYLFEMDDGSQWGVPVARDLPCTWRMGADGKVQRQVRDQYRKFWDWSGEWFDRFREKVKSVTDLQPFWQEAWEYLSYALGMNYRLTPEVISHLGLINDEVVVGMIWATLDLKAILAEQEDQKKSG